MKREVKRGKKGLAGKRGRQDEGVVRGYRGAKEIILSGHWIAVQEAGHH